LNEKEEEDDIILHLPISSSEINKLKNNPTDNKNNPTDKVKNDNCIFTINDIESQNSQSSQSSDNSESEEINSHHDNKIIEKQQKIIDKLNSQLNEYKKIYLNHSMISITKILQK